MGWKRKQQASHARSLDDMDDMDMGNHSIQGGHPDVCAVSLVVSG